MPVIEAAVAPGLRPVVCRQERVGVDMASGFVRTSNGHPPAVFAMQYGRVANAYSDCAPGPAASVRAAGARRPTRMISISRSRPLYARPRRPYAEASADLLALADLPPAPE